MTKPRRMHPVSIFLNISKFLILLLIPITRGFIGALKNDFYAWVSGAWFDILVLLFILGASVIQWWLCVYSYSPKGIWFRSGVVFQKEVRIPTKHLCTLSLISPYYLRPFGLALLRMDTAAGSSRSPDISLILRKKHAQEMAASFDRRNDPEYLVREYHPKQIYVTALSAVMSNSFAGILFLSALISQAGKILGEAFSARIYGTFEQLTRVLAFGIPPAAVAVAYTLLGGYLVMFVVFLIRYFNFRVRRYKEMLEVTGGFPTKRTYEVDVSMLNYVDIRQSVSTYLIGLHSVFLNIAGFGKHKDDMDVLIPAVTTRNLKHSLKLLLPEYKRSERQLKPNFGAIMKFILDPFWFLMGVVALSLFLYWIFPSWMQFIQFVGMMSLLPPIWLLMIRIIDFSTTGVSKSDGVYTLRYSEGYYLHTVILPEDKISTVCLRQSILQMNDNKCDVLIFSKSESFKRHHIKNLDRTEAKRMFHMFIQGDPK